MKNDSISTIFQFERRIAIILRIRAVLNRIEIQRIFAKVPGGSWR